MEERESHPSRSDRDTVEIVGASCPATVEDGASPSRRSVTGEWHLEGERRLGACPESIFSSPSSSRSTRPWPAGPVRRRSPAGELRIDSLSGFVRVTNLLDQPWKIARMNKFTYALALGAGLVLSLAAPNAQADPIVQSLSHGRMSASQFNSLFTPDTGACVTQHYSFMNTGTAGTVSSRRCSREPALAAGSYAYAYQFTSTTSRTRRPATDQRQQRVDAVQRDPGCHQFHGPECRRATWSPTARSARSTPRGRRRDAAFRRRRRSPGSPVRRPDR